MVAWILRYFIYYSNNIPLIEFSSLSNMGFLAQVYKLDNFTSMDLAPWRKRKEIEALHRWIDHKIPFNITTLLRVWCFSDSEGKRVFFIYSYIYHFDKEAYGNNCPHFSYSMNRFIRRIKWWRLLRIYFIVYPLSRVICPPKHYIGAC